MAVSHSEALREVGDSILYITALLNDRPRGIDRYIDYFGDSGTRPAARDLRDDALLETSA